MRKPLIAACIAAAMLGTSGCATLSAEDEATQGDYAALSAAIAAPHRTQANTARDRYRNPLETLSFFGVQPNHTVVEIWPGGGWYTEISGALSGARRQLLRRHAPGSRHRALPGIHDCQSESLR
jgi:predicted methyltransferase